MSTFPKGPTTTLSFEDGIKALTGLWENQLTLEADALVVSGGADVANDLFGGIGTPTVATPEPAAEPAAALAKPTTGTESGTLASDSPIHNNEKICSKAAAVSPKIRKKPASRPHGVPSATPRAANVDYALSSSDDELPTGAAGDHAWEDPKGAFASDGDSDSDEDLDAPARPVKSRKAPVGKGTAPRARARSLGRTLTPREKETRRQERNDARAKSEELRKKREQEGEYNRVSEVHEARQSCRSKGLDMLEWLIPLGLDDSGKSTHFRRQNVATRKGMEPPVAVPAALDANVRVYLNQPKFTPAAQCAPRAILHNRVLALQRATSAPGAIGVFEMRRALKNPKWLPYERQRDMKNKVTTKSMDPESRKAHSRMLAIQAAEFDRVASEQRKARLKAAREAFSATECAVPTWTGKLPANKGMAMTQSPLSAAC